MDAFRVLHHAHRAWQASSQFWVRPQWDSWSVERGCYTRQGCSDRCIWFSVRAYGLLFAVANASPQRIACTNDSPYVLS